MIAALVVLSLVAPHPANGAMILAARETRPSVLVTVDVVPALAAHGVAPIDVRAQVEQAVRRCGMAVVRQVGTAGSPPMLLSVTTGGTDLDPDHGFSGGVTVSLTLLRTVEGVPAVPLQAYLEASGFVGPPARAAEALRTALARRLDDLCSRLLAARQDQRR